MVKHNLPDEFSYSQEHIWVGARPEYLLSQTVPVGITSIATAALGEILYVNLPAIGRLITAGKKCGEVEVSKTIADIYAPVTGRVVAVNSKLQAYPAMINANPYQAGWLFKVEVSAFEPLLTATEYLQQNQSS